MSAWTSDDLATLEKAIAQGVTEVRYGDKTVIYRSLNDMLRTVDMMRKDLGVSTGNQNRKYAQITKGFE